MNATPGNVHLSGMAAQNCHSLFRGPGLLLLLLLLRGPVCVCAALCFCLGRFHPFPKLLMGHILTIPEVVAASTQVLRIYMCIVLYLVLIMTPPHGILESIVRTYSGLDVRCCNAERDMLLHTWNQRHSTLCVESARGILPPT
jgi:hypothetical protein